MVNEDLIYELRRIMNSYGDCIRVVICKDNEVQGSINTINYNADTHEIELSVDKRKDD